MQSFALSSSSSVPPWTPSPPQASPKSQSLLDWLKPHRSVAIARLKNNGLAMVVLLLVTQLAPITPSPLRCLWLVLGGGKGMSGLMYWSCCAGMSPQVISLFERQTELVYDLPFRTISILCHFLQLTSGIYRFEVSAPIMLSCGLAS